LSKPGKLVKPLQPLRPLAPITSAAKKPTASMVKRALRPPMRPAMLPKR
jgi:hypothetical protein